jgi:tryptophan synthase alpha chain
MGRLGHTFERLAAEGRKALITFITAGDPDLSTTGDLVLELERSGADIIELGIPFSDPMADGPTIQASSERALKAGVRLPDVLGLVSDARARSAVPIVLFGYYNPVFAYGIKRFALDAKEAGADGALVVDLPPEESGDLKRELGAAGLDLILLVTPTSDDARMRLVAGNASGFIYFVSVTGVTGARRGLPEGVAGRIKRLKRFTKIPVGVGFGISTPRQAAEVCRGADGAVVGSAIVNIIAAHANEPREALMREVGSFVSGLRKGIDAARRATHAGRG